MRKFEDQASLNVAFDELKREFERLKGQSSSALLSFGASSIDTSASDRYMWPFRTSSTADSTEQKVHAPRAGKITGLSAYIPTAGTAAADRTIELVLRKRGLDTPIKVQFTIPRFVGVLRSSNKAEISVERDELLSVVVRKSGSLTGSPETIIVLVEIE